MTEVVVTSSAVKRAKLQSNTHHQQTNTQLLTGWMTILLPNQQYQSTEGKSFSTGKTTEFPTTITIFPTIC